MRYFLNKVIQKVVVFFVPSRIVFERSAAEEEKSMRTKTADELHLRARGLKEVCTVLDKFAIPYYLAGGALLGIVRDGDFIAWDGDVDIDVKTEDIYPIHDKVADAFKKAGYQISRYTSSKIDFRIKMFKYGSQYEIVGYFKMGSMRYRKWSRYPDAFMQEATTVTLHDEKYRTFGVPERYLEWFYGNWRTPVRVANHHEYVTSHSRTGPVAMMLLRVTAMCTRF